MRDMHLDHQEQHEDEAQVEEQVQDDVNVTDSSATEDHESQHDISMEVDEVKADETHEESVQRDEPAQDGGHQVEQQPQGLASAGSLFSPNPNNHGVYHIFDECEFRFRIQF